MAFGHQHSTTMTHGSQFQKEKPKVQKTRRKSRKKIFNEDVQRGMLKLNAFEGKPVALQSALVGL